MRCWRERKDENECERGLNGMKERLVKKREKAMTKLDSVNERRNSALPVRFKLSTGVNSSFHHLSLFFFIHLLAYSHLWSSEPF